MFLQGKGGVGKSFAATLLAQQMKEEGKNPLCIDIDPHNATFSSYKALDVQSYDVMEGDDVNPRKFDKVMELVAESKEDVIIDNGSSSYIALASYMKKMRVAEVLHSMGHNLIIHTLIVGGNVLVDTVDSLVKTISIFPEDTKYVVWLNPFSGPIENNGSNFYGFKAYKNNSRRINVVIEIPDYEPKTFGHDLREMMAENLTFREALEKESGLPMWTRQRLSMMREEIYQRLGQVAGIA
jgi:hypothetical protein